MGDQLKLSVESSPLFGKGGGEETRQWEGTVKDDSRVAVGNDAVEHQLVEVGRLKPQHLKDTSATDTISRASKLRTRPIGSGKGGIDEKLAVAIEKIKGIGISTGRDLDELCEAVSDLGFGKGS